MVQSFLQYYRILSVIWLFLIQIPLNSASARDDLTVVPYVPNFVTLDYSRDNDEGRGTILLANLGITYKDRVLLGVGEDKQTVSGTEEDLDNNTYILGYRFIPHLKMQFGADYEHWGDNSKVTVDTIRMVAAFRWEKIAVTVTPEYRNINVNNDSQCSEHIYSRSASVDLIVDINPEISFNLGYADYDYSNNLNELGNCVDTAEQLGVESRIDSVANDSVTFVGLDYYLDSETFGGSVSQTKTALFGLNARTVSIYASTDRFDDWTLTATAGITDNTDDTTTTFLNGSVTYYW